MADVTDAWLQDLPLDTCLHHLREGSVGRIAVVIDTFPVVLPVNYRLVETSGRTWLAIRTRPGNVIERAPIRVGFEIDGIDPVHQQGWSVLVRGTLLHVDPDAAGFGERFDPHPWLLAQRDAWLVIEPFAITGRQLHREQVEWLFLTRGYP
jgi:nitroimidazol reductase NimA-like FMN-containing flavoprotein (pyridoxamine 5'-phosphate oxidase superfamily)